MERLEVAAAAFKLPCANNCPFKKECSVKFSDGVCESRIKDFIKNKIYGKPGKLILDKQKINFSTSDPDGNVQIYNGWGHVTR